MRLPELIGQRLRKRREELGFSQTKMGANLEVVTGRKWTPQAVSAAEKGRRDWKAEDILAVSLYLGRPIQWFFTPDDDTWIDLPNGAKVKFEAGDEPLERVRSTEQLAADLARDARELRDRVVGGGARLTIEGEGEE